MSDSEASQLTEQLELEEEEEDFTNLPLYADNEDESDVSEFQLPSESENARGKKNRPKSKSRRSSRRPSHDASPELSLAHRPAPKKSSVKKVSQGMSEPESRGHRGSESEDFERNEHPDVTARRLENRKRSASPRPPSKQSKLDKRRKMNSDSQYRELLNEQIGDVNNPKSEWIEPKVGRGVWKARRKMQVGASIWRPSEKNRLFIALEKVGKHDLKALSEFIGTKSQAEVQEYIQVFEGEMEKRGKSGRISSWKIHEVDIPAAAEISVECEQILEEAADALADKEERNQRKKEITKWGADAWLLSAKNVSWIEKEGKEKAGDTVIKEVLPSAELLHLRNWLKVSKGVFMNPRDRPDQNWQSLIRPGEEVGIYASAFQDFGCLTVNLTKRIMAASLFCAESRLRADDSWYTRKHGRQPKVTHVDVAQAVEGMGLKLDSHEFWRTAPRRNNLEMVDDEVEDRNGGVAPMSHELVEKVLSKRKNMRSRRRRRALELADQATIESGASVYDSEESEGSHISVSSDEDDEAHATQEISKGALKMAPTTPDERYISLGRIRSHFHAFSPPPSPKPFDDQTPEERHVAYVESVDHVENVKAEVALWNMLQQDHPFEPEEMDIDAAEASVLPRVVLKEKDQLQTDKWRERAEYWAPWEHLEGLPTEEDFKRRSKKREYVALKDVSEPAIEVRRKAARLRAEKARRRAKSKDKETIDITDSQSRATSHLNSDSSDSENEPRGFSDQDSVLGTRRADMARQLDSSSPVLTRKGGKIKSQEETQAREARYASPVFTNTQLDDLLVTQQPLGSLPEMRMGVDDSDHEGDRE